MGIEPTQIHVVGGVYEERCMRPAWHEIFGSAGRAASAIAAVAGPGVVNLHCLVDSQSRDVVAARLALEGSMLHPTEVYSTCKFAYVHGLDRPEVAMPSGTQRIEVRGQSILRFGMLDGDAVVHGDRVVYDPQNAVEPKLFQDNGSDAGELAIVLNEREAVAQTGGHALGPVDLAASVLERNGAQAVVLKRGPLGAILFDGKTATNIPAYLTSRVWKIGSGDVFTAHFAFHWTHQKSSLELSATLASMATALYCDSGAFPLKPFLDSFQKQQIVPSARFVAGHRPIIYLAGPFFNLPQQWLIEQARTNLQGFGLRVFSPLHDVGRGSADDVVELDLAGIVEADLVFAIGDGLDAGTIYEIGYARALKKPVVVYCENEPIENLKMMVGSGCQVRDDYVTAIYTALWTAIRI
jgi:nucleoside 2-deoxyribosyltransferase